MENLNLLFNKCLYAEFGSSSLQQAQSTAETIIQEEILPTQFRKADYQPLELDGVSRIYMKVCYPGLTMGLGYPHAKSTDGIKSGDAEREFQPDNGFSFDYVTGQPFIPGSSVKGVLRSSFRQPDVIRELMQKDKDVNIGELEIRIFEGEDVFFDAVIRHGDSRGHIVATDSITPHGNNPLKSPEPHTIFRVPPEVVMEFRFLLKDDNQVKAQEKLELFSKLLEFFGIGAKTNVGYGTLERVEEEKVAAYRYPDDAWENQFPVNNRNQITGVRNTQRQGINRFQQHNNVSRGSYVVQEDRMVASQGNSISATSRQNDVSTVSSHGQSHSVAPQGWPEIGSILDGKVNNCIEYGVFVSVTGGKSGLIHKSKMYGKMLNKGENCKVRVLSYRIRQDKNGNPKTEMALELVP